VIIDHIRDLDEFRAFYYTYKYPGLYDFNWIVNNPNLFCLYDEDSVLWGYISVQREHGVLSLSGASKRKNMQENINFINMVCDAFDEDMYAFTRVRPAIAVLRKASFKKVYDDKYVRLKRGKENG
jgi:hypothetical protein